MRKILFVTIISLLLDYQVRAGDDFITTFSPKLREYLASHPPALQLLTNTHARAFSNRTVQLFYFYSQSKSIPKAYHYYPGDSTVGIVVCENQPVLDEYLSIIFEMINSEGEKAFEEVYRKAGARQVSKAEFVEAIMRGEFDAVKRVQHLIRDIDFGKKEEAESVHHKIFLESPKGFEDFLVYTRKVSKHGDVVHRLEVTYDSLQKN